MLNDTELAQIFGMRESSIRKFREGTASYLTQKRIKERAKEKGIDLKKELALTDAISTKESTTKSIWAEKLGVNNSTLKRYFKGNASYGSKKKIESLAKQNNIDLNIVKEEMNLIEEKINNEPNNDKLYEIANSLKVRPSTIKKYCEGKISYMAKKRLESNAKELNIDLSELSNIIDFPVIKDTKENIGIKNFKFNDYEFSVWEFGETNKSRIAICKCNVDTNHTKSRNNTIKELENIISSIYGIPNNNGEGIDYANHQIEVYFNINDSYQNVFNKVKNYLVANVNTESEKNISFDSI